MPETNQACFSMDNILVTIILRLNIYLMQPASYCVWHASIFYPFTCMLNVNVMVQVRDSVVGVRSWPPAVYVKFEPAM